VGVLGLDLQHALEGLAGLLEAAQLEQRHAPLVAGRRVLGQVLERRRDRPQRLRRAAQVDEGLALEQRQVPAPSRSLPALRLPRRAYSRPMAARSADGGRWLT
jgi:hypothetical protein